MATLADELLADLMSDGSDVSGAEDSDNDEHQDELEAGLQDLGEEEEEAEDDTMNEEFASLVVSLKPVSMSLHLSQTLSELLRAPESSLLQKANALSSAISDEITTFHKTLRDHYSVRFPELESLVQNPTQYVRTVGVIGNGPMDTIPQAPLKEILDASLVMAVKLEASRTLGRDMTEAEAANIQRYVSMSVALDEARRFLTDYVQSRINQIAPNLTVILGPETAARLVSTAGGLAALAKMPACNVPAMGSRQQAKGLATNTRVRRQGHLYDSPIVQSVPPDHREQAMRIVAAKLILAARCDLVHATPDGSTGEQFKHECEDRIEKLSITAPNARTRALPAPDDKPARKRGGRRVRKAKEQYAMTDLRRAQNRMTFGREEAEVGIDGDTVGLGQIGQSNDGRVRAMGIDQRTKAKLSKKNPGWGTNTPAGGSGLASSLRGFGQGSGTGTVLQGHGLRSAGVGGGGGPGAGTSSVIAFTPFQGLELVNPKAREETERKRKAEEDRWFKSGTFTQVGSGAAPQKPGDTKTDGGFKVPAIPAIKRVKKTE